MTKSAIPTGSLQKTISNEQLLAEVQELIRIAPGSGKMHTEFGWLGRVQAAMNAWDTMHGIEMSAAISNLHSAATAMNRPGYAGIMTLLHTAYSSLQIDTIGPMSVSFPSGGVFNYFDEIRKIVETASKDIFFVDPYLDADFVARYLPHVKDGTKTRLLTSEKRIATLIPAVTAFATQHGVAIQVRTRSDFHDRYVFADSAACYQSGASFKDGAKSSPTTLTQITDAFVEMHKIYEGLWDHAKIQI